MNLEQIDTSTTAGKAEVMRLAAEGRRVACKGRFLSTCEWLDVTTPNWDWTMYEFAIISEPFGPEEVWGLVHDGGSVLALSSTRLEASERQSLVRYIRADLAGEKGE